MENLKALVYKGDLTPYQRALAQREFEGLIKRIKKVYCVINDCNYYSEPVTIEIFDTEQKAIDYCKNNTFDRLYWEEIEVK